MDSSTPDPGGANPLAYGGRQERAVLAVLVESQGRVIGRRELARRAGLAELSDRRCDSILVTLRRVLGPASIITVRRRGWMLAQSAMADHLFAERGERAS